MTIQELEKIMQEHGLVIRALPKKRRQVLEAGYKTVYPDGTIMYMEEFKRKMLVREQDLAPHLAGKFLIQSVKGTSADVHFEHGPAVRQRRAAKKMPYGRGCLIWRRVIKTVDQGRRCHSHSDLGHDAARPDAAGPVGVREGEIR